MSSYPVRRPVRDAESGRVGYMRVCGDPPLESPDDDCPPSNGALFDEALWHVFDRPRYPDDVFPHCYDDHGGNESWNISVLTPPIRRRDCKISHDGCCFEYWMPQGERCQHIVEIDWWSDSVLVAVPGGGPQGQGWRPPESADEEEGEEEAGEEGDSSSDDSDEAAANGGEDDDDDEADDDADEDTMSVAAAASLEAARRAAANGYILLPSRWGRGEYRGKKTLPPLWSAHEYSIGGTNEWIFWHPHYGETRNARDVFWRTDAEWLQSIHGAQEQEEDETD